MQVTIGDLTKKAQTRERSFFMKKGIPYDIIDEYEDEGRFYLVGVSDDGEEATEEILMLRKEQIGARLDNNTMPRKEQIGQQSKSTI